MNAPEFVLWMQDNGWSAAGLAAAMDGQVSERTIWRWRSGQSEISAAMSRRLKRLRVKPEHRRVKQRSRWAARVVD